MYSFDHAEQLNTFLMSLGAGFLLGVVYDILRCIRLSVSKGKAAVFVFDILYFIIFGFASFIFIFAANYGEVRFYIIFGECIGALFYYFSFGLAAIKITDVFVKAFRFTVKLIFKVASAPFRLVFRLFQKVFGIFKVFTGKISKNFSKSSKKLLPKLKRCVYNLLGILRMHKKRTGKGRHKREKHKEAEKAT